MTSSVRAPRDPAGVAASPDGRLGPEPAGGRGATNANPSGRFWSAVAIATVVSLPFCWLLSYAALLPFFIGLFFFALFGLMIGGALYRVAAPRRPYRPSVVIAGTTMLVFFVWAASVLKESIDLPKDMAGKAADRAVHLRGVPVEQFRDNVAAEVRAFIRGRYPPGGMIGYVRWALDTGRFKKGDLSSVEFPIALNQTRYIFAIRLVLSIGLLAFGIASQTWPLKASRPRLEEPSSDRA